MALSVHAGQATRLTLARLAGVRTGNPSALPLGALSVTALSLGIIGSC